MDHLVRHEQWRVCRARLRRRPLHSSEYGACTSRFSANAGTISTSLFDDDDGQGYVCLASSPPAVNMRRQATREMANCHFLGDDASIERSTPGLLSSARLGVRNVFLNRRTHARSAANCYTLGHQLLCRSTV